jgi:hypothetical protein
MRHHVLLLHDAFGRRAFVLPIWLLVKGFNSIASHETLLAPATMTLEAA